MAEVLAAYAEYKRTDEAALAMRARSRAVLGLSVVQERAKGTSQQDISKKLGVVVEQVRRYQQAYKDWMRNHPGEDPRTA